MPFSCFHVEVTSPPCGGGLRLWCSQAALPWARPEGPSLSPRGPKLEGHVHCPLPGAWPFLSAPSPPSQPRLLAPPFPCKPSWLLKAPAGVRRAGTGGFKPHSLHTSINVHFIGFWRKTGSYLTTLVVMLPECLRKARNLDFCVKSVSIHDHQQRFHSSRGPVWVTTDRRWRTEFILRSTS